MFRVAAARLLSAAPLLLGVSFVSFLLLHLAPGSFVDRLRLDPGIPPSTIDALVSRFGLDKPWYQQYLSWLTGAVHGDLGMSLAFRRPVGELLGEAVFYTLALVLAALVISSLVGSALGLLAMLRPGGFLDRLLAGSALGVVSIPILVLAVVGLGLASVTGFLPTGGGSVYGSLDLPWSMRALDFASHLLLPTLILSIGMSPLFFLQTRGALLEVLPSEFVRAARSRGVSEGQILLRHGLRPSLVPLITFAGASLARMLNGAFLVEVVVGWPGMGRLALDGLLARDSFLILGVLVLASILILLGNLMTDLLTGAADPRIRMEEA
jgi:peptide/nickel transport system permease protein